MPEESSYSSCFFFPPSPSASVKFNFKNIFFILFIFVLTVTYLLKRAHIKKENANSYLTLVCRHQRAMYESNSTDLNFNQFLKHTSHIHQLHGHQKFLGQAVRVLIAYAWLGAPV